MELIESELAKLAENIKELDKKREVLGRAISGIKDKLLFPSQDPDILEDKFVFKVEPHALDKLKVAAIDGGVVSSRYHGTNLVLGRAAAVIFEFKKGQLLETEYYPDAFPKPTPFAFTSPISTHDFLVGTSLERAKLEIVLAARTAEKFKPDLLLLDGSVLPHGMDKPQKDSLIYKTYTELVQAYETLYETCKKNKVLLAGVVEDSSGLRLTKLLKDKIVPGIIKGNEFPKDINTALTSTKDILEQTNDSNIMYYILGVGERSCAFSYSKDPAKHQILRDLKKWAGSISSFYLKSVEFDRPIRIDFLNGDARIAGKVASVTYALSMHNETYGCPSVIIEADARAKLSEKDLDIIYHRLKDKLGDVPSLFKLRRELRPF